MEGQYQGIDRTVIASLLRIADDRGRWAANAVEASVGVPQAHQLVRLGETCVTRLDSILVKIKPKNPTIAGLAAECLQRHSS